MAKGDKLDALLADERITDEEWAALAEVLGIYKILSKKKNERRVIVNKEFRHYFGHTLAN